MLKRLLDGLVFGTGFATAFVAVCIAGFYYALPAIINSQSGAASRSEREVSLPPAIGSRQRFLGSTGIFSGDFDKSNGILAKGDGRIAGNAAVNGQPLEGLGLRLALNGSVMSQWALTDKDGNYSIAVPYGTYVIHGFELDSETAHKVLPNKIMHPENAHSTGTFEVTNEADGRGLAFRFIDPITKKPQKRKFSVADAIVLEWEPYPDAAHYEVQIHERSDPYSWNSHGLFEWSNRPSLTEARLDVTEHGLKLKPGHFYTYDVTARNQQNRALSETARAGFDFDFEISE